MIEFNIIYNPKLNVPSQCYIQSQMSNLKKKKNDLLSISNILLGSFYGTFIYIRILIAVQCAQLHWVLLVMLFDLLLRNIEERERENGENGINNIK